MNSSLSKQFKDVIINKCVCIKKNNVSTDFNVQWTRNVNNYVCPDWNTLIVGKLSSWIEADSELETVRRNSEAVSSSS